MPKRIANNTIILYREGKRVRIPAGKAFDFTAKELEDLKASSPDSIRTPRDESESVQTIEAPKTDTGKGGKQQGGKNQGKNQGKPESKPEGDGEGAGAEGGQGGADGEEEL
jgi:hypothetical protein